MGSSSCRAQGDCSFSGLEEEGIGEPSKTGCELVDMEEELTSPGQGSPVNKQIDPLWLVPW